jgi:hypothetical protein
MIQIPSNSPLHSFACVSEPKIAPIVVGSALFVGKAIAGAAIGTAASWGTTRFLDNRFPQRK